MKLFFEQVEPVERSVVGLDAGQRGALVTGQFGWVFQ